MTRSRHIPHSQNRQRGVALVAAMVFLLLLTIIGVTAMTTTSLEEKMAGNTQDKNVAFQAAESALRVAEVFLLGTDPSALPDFALNKDGYYEPTNPGSAPRWESVDWKNCAAGVDAVVCLPANTLSGVNTQPAYIIEKVTEVDPGGGPAAGDSLGVGFGAPPAAPGKQGMYRITAHGTGGTDSSVAEVQSVYRR